MSAETGEKKTKKEMSFEDAIGKLENIVRTLEVGDVKLEEALRLFEEGSELSQKCLSDLDRIGRRLEMLRVVDGKIRREDIEGPAAAKPGGAEEE